MKQLRILAEKIEQTQEIIKSRIHKKFPVITSISIYRDNNIQIQSEHFSIDMYEGREYTADDIRMNCNMAISQIPTEAEAIAQVKTLKAERTLFIKAFQHTLDKVLNDESN